ncbi:hypothetical protein ACFW08_33815 [Streptomyces sp. NPDC058960]|uniref:hypothetical protein n=1 Tax=Streptomyces sp. NPDC058960 TaxID=3346679 RepID=UPI0036868C3C
MALSADILELCRATFAPELLDLALRTLETYDAEQTDRVHRLAIQMSEGKLHRLAWWLNAAEENLETFLWYGEDPEETVRPETRAFAVDFMNGFADKNMLKPPPSSS